MGTWIFTKWDNSAGVPKLWTSTFLMYFGVLNLDSGNQIWKFKYRYFGKFSDFEFNKYHIFWTLDIYQIKIGLSLKSLGTTVLFIMLTCKYNKRSNTDGKNFLSFINNCFSNSLDFTFWQKYWALQKTFQWL